MQYVKTSADADEIVSDAFMVLWEKRAELILDENLRPLLYTIVRNKSINLLKKRKLEVTELDQGFEVLSDTGSPADLLQARETEEMVHRLIDELPPRCRQIFVLSRREQMSNREIAELMQLNEKTVENQITIAIRYIRAGLRKNQQGGGQDKTLLFPWILIMLAEGLTLHHSSVS